MTGLIVAGMHRSGTSLVTRLLQEGGWHAGEEQLRSENEEYFEDATFVELHRRWLAECLPPGGGHADWGLSDAGAPQPSQLVGAGDAVLAFHATRERQRPRWVAKDPRASLFLDQWATVDSLRFVLVYRSSWDVTDSAIRLGHPPFCADPSILRTAWVLYNRRVVEFARRHRERCVVLASEALAADPHAAWDLLAADVGLDGDLPPALLDTGKLATRDRCHPIAELTRHLHPECAALLDELDGLADMPRPQGDANRPWATLLPAGTLPTGTGLQVVVPCRDDGAFLDEAIASVAAACVSPTELTIVDDGSTGGETLRILGVLRAIGHDVVESGGVGLPAARNRGVRASRSLAVLPLDADNRVLPSLPAGLALIEAGEADVVHGSWQEFGLRARRVDPPDASWETLLPANGIDACSLIRRDLFERVGGYDEALPFLEDWALWLAALAVGARFHRLTELTFRYLVRPGSLVSTVWDDDARFVAALHRTIDPHAEHTGDQTARIVHQLLTSMKGTEVLMAALEAARAAEVDLREGAAAAAREADNLRSRVDMAAAELAAEIGSHADTEARLIAAKAEMVALERRSAELSEGLVTTQQELIATKDELAAVRARRGYRVIDALARRTMWCRRPFAAVARGLARLRVAAGSGRSTQG